MIPTPHNQINPIHQLYQWVTEHIVDQTHTIMTCFHRWSAFRVLQTMWRRIPGLLSESSTLRLRRMCCCLPLECRLSKTLSEHVTAALTFTLLYWPDYIAAFLLPFSFCILTHVSVKLYPIHLLCSFFFLLFKRIIILWATLF